MLATSVTLDGVDQIVRFTRHVRSCAELLFDGSAFDSAGFVNSEAVSAVFSFAMFVHSGGGWEASHLCVHQSIF